jgi:putative transposase
LEGNIQVDHIHLVLSIPPKYSISEAIGFLKGKSAIKTFIVGSIICKNKEYLIP